MNESLLRLAFENIAPHIMNLEYMKNLIEQLVSSEIVPSRYIQALEKEKKDKDITIQTDIRILISEFKHLRNKVFLE
ncbi:MAG: hypothetical protein GF411_06600 [Candidatus Lokiarchaeota archaeon]|nr:hypothetical protein [Candidatus Lokiarchaeota archaeon]